MKSPTISFVVPSYNYAQYLPDCLDSIFAQDGKFDFEVLLIDDDVRLGALLKEYLGV